MAVDADQRVRDVSLEALAEAATAAAHCERPDQAFAAIAAAARRAARADAAVVRVLDRGRDELVARAVAGSVTVVAQLEGSRVPRRHGLEPRASAWLGGNDALVVPVEWGGELVGALELVTLSGPLASDADAVASAFAAQLALVVRVAAAEDGAAARRSVRAIAIAGDALAAGAEINHSEERLLRVALSLTGADGALLWRSGTELTLAAAAGDASHPGAGDARAAALRALEEPTGQVEHVDSRLAVALRLGEPPLGVLQLFFDAGSAAPPDLDGLTVFALRAAQALRAAETVRATAAELEQTRALLAAVAEASEQLSLAHAVDTTIARVRELVGAERIAVYLREDGRLVPAAARDLAGPHVRIAEALLELALGPFRARGVVMLADARAERRLRRVADAIGESGIEAVVALPLLVVDEVIGLLAAYPPRRRLPDASGAALVAALAGQLAVTVQNARLHDRATRLGQELEQALAAERDAARRLRAQNAISDSFTKTLSLDETVAAVVTTVVENLAVDAAVIHMPDPRRELLLAHQDGLRIADERVANALRPILVHPQRVSDPAYRRVFERGTPRLLDPSSAPLLAPFLEKGSTAAVVPIATSTQVIAMLTIMSLRPEAPIAPATVEMASTIATQAALALDNARLYQQQKDFAEAMQRSLLPLVRPPVRGLDLGEVYAASARADLGGDLYDYVELADGRLAVIVADVSGHGIHAAADMAMAKYVFRALVREHTQPGDFVRAANDVVVGEIGGGKFITLVYLVVDPATGEVACASAGHPPPRVVAADGAVHALAAGGLALGVARGEQYQEVRARLAPGAAVVLYTDGVIEARAGADFYGVERLDAVVARLHRRKAEDIAAAVIESARRFTGGELLDDCAVVVVKRP